MVSGPRLVIAQNLKLKEIKFSDHFMAKSRPNSVVIRGNPMLQRSTIERLRKKFKPGALDLQVFGECGPPLPFNSFAVFSGCTKVFGVISVNRNISEVVRLPNVKSLHFEGCLHIIDTKISNVDFLDDISIFTKSPYHEECAHEIADNSNLCIRDPQHVKRKFEGLVILQNENCDAVCRGGVVNDEYLATVDGCKTIDGDLIFHDFNNTNSSFDNLYSIERINGSLHITGSYGFGKFDALGRLKEIIVPEGKNGSAIEIVGNTGLISLEFPQLAKIVSSDEIKIRVVNNPSLTMKKALVERMYELADGKSHTEIEYTDSSTLADKFSEHTLGILALILILLIILVMLCIVCIFLIPYYHQRQAVNKHGFPNPPWSIGKKSKEILAGWVKDIVDKNPLIWRCSDRDVIWSYGASDGAHRDIEVLVANNAQFLNDHMLPLATNAKIGESDRFLLCERLKTFLDKEVVIVIGADNHPSGVVPHLPEVIKGEHTYKYLGTTYSCTLTKIKVMAPNTKEYTYTVVTTPKDGKASRKTMKILYHKWSDNEMPKEYDEILQLAMAYKPNKTICASDRRKEVFSLLHLFHTFCLVLQEPINLVDALQLHTEKCNGAILDRSELGFVMAVIMEWAYQSRSITPELKKKHMEWCHTYAIMDRFMRKNGNIKLIHPDYLPKLDSHIRHSVLVDRFMSSPRFSERESAAISDPFRRRNAEEVPIYKKRVNINGKEGDVEDDDESTTSRTDDAKFWLNKKKSDSLNKSSERKYSRRERDSKTKSRESVRKKGSKEAPPLLGGSVERKEQRQAPKSFWAWS